ncbi:spike base protein, RCAP_Rcc01079 family [Actibacterium lipolyticum]|uniref:Uncharacterized protein n=1 Tax=Actibacterium lipolyticum TaxID=1524263 RepID=A0A238KUX4_9RHOB|nr:hypothetical protein [Actibacterium lipolyticum]SMX46507.1 hypothetical protein COL8621_03140 [Actibacterium lipolyticum]
MPNDSFKDFATSLYSPAERIEEIIPDDLTDLAHVTRALNVSVAGTVRVITAGGDESDVFIAAGVPFPLRVTRVLATGTSATGIRGLY